MVSGIYRISQIKPVLYSTLQNILFVFLFKYVYLPYNLKVFSKYDTLVFAKVSLETTEEKKQISTNYVLIKGLFGLFGVCLKLYFFFINFHMHN